MVRGLAKKDRKYVSGWIFPKTVASKNGDAICANSLALSFHREPFLENPSLSIGPIFWGVFGLPCHFELPCLFSFFFSSTPFRVNVLVKFIYLSFFFVALSFLNIASLLLNTFP